MKVKLIPEGKRLHRISDERTLETLDRLGILYTPSNVPGLSPEFWVETHSKIIELTTLTELVELIRHIDDQLILDIDDNGVLIIYVS